MNLENLSPQQLRRLAELKEEMNRIIEGGSAEAPKRRGRPPGSGAAGNAPAATAGNAQPKKRKMSAEGRARIAAAARARWAKVKAGK